MKYRINLRNGAQYTIEDHIVLPVREGPNQMTYLKPWELRRGHQIWARSQWQDIESVEPVGGYLITQKDKELLRAFNMNWDLPGGSELEDCGEASGRKSPDCVKSRTMSG